MTEETSIESLINTVVDGKIDDYDVNIETGKLKGENFLGDIVFVGLKNKKTKEDLHFIVKQAIDVGNMAFLNVAYPTEINFYEEIWPTLNKFQEASTVDFNNIAQCYSTCKTKGKEILVLEDLNYKDFKLFDKTKALEHQHLEHIFKCYGKYHAISFAFSELHPEEFSRLASMSNKNVFKSPEKPEKADQQTIGDNPYINLLFDFRNLFDKETEGNILNTYNELLGTIMCDAFGKIMDSKGEGRVLIHGDCWSNNMMFKYDEKGNVIDMKLIDFQMIHANSPVKDLSYCLYTGASKESLDKLDELLTLYMNAFNETLEKLECTPEKPYTGETLKKEWQQLSLFGFMVAVSIWRMKLASKKNIPKITDFDDTKPEGITLPTLAEEYVDIYNKRMKDMIIHFCENRFF